MPAFLKNIRRLRDDIDRIDARIIRMLKKRFDAVRKIGHIKKMNNIEITDLQRENFLNERLNALADEYKIEPNFLARLWKEILSESYRVQRESEDHE